MWNGHQHQQTRQIVHKTVVVGCGDDRPNICPSIQFSSRSFSRSPQNGRRTLTWDRTRMLNMFGVFFLSIHRTERSPLLIFRFVPCKMPNHKMIPIQSETNEISFGICRTFLCSAIVFCVDVIFDRCSRCRELLNETKQMDRDKSQAHDSGQFHVLCVTAAGLYCGPIDLVNTFRWIIILWPRCWHPWFGQFFSTAKLISFDFGVSSWFADGNKSFFRFWFFVTEIR